MRKMIEEILEQHNVANVIVDVFLGKEDELEFIIVKPVKDED
jgi:hypothetical protein